ncbi:MAG TPA: nucleoside-diphosphate sugar epimerase [Candidatus Atribacteria bacterium]|jgi:FlaA1/EpsC-like NDP-sugar epimerase|nr:MAG: putative nucleoside-diphosphate sugar epimerase [Atribacteria bacterium 34_128]HAJ32556.1 nucleoside-diphosphate sugar epimerase [Candidatus Atribacteria bacterium]
MKNIIRRFSWVVLDIVFINVSLILSLILRFGEGWRTYFYVYRGLIIYLSGFFLLFAVVFRLYKRIWRYLSISDLFLIAEVVTGGIFATVLCLNLVKGIAFPRTVVALTWFFSLALVGGSRLVWRLYCERKGALNRGQERILIVGAGDAGEVISREIIRRPDLGKLVGFVDDDAEKIGKRIHNVKVLGNVEGLNDVLEKEQIDSVIIAIPTATGKQIKRIVENIKNKEVKVKTLPGLYELVDGKVSVSRIRNIRIEDLLGREPVDLNLEEISGYLEGKRVMVTGGGGSIGGELARQICRFGPKRLILLDHSENGLFHINLELEGKLPEVEEGTGARARANMEIELVVADIRDRKKMDKIFKKYVPEVVFHAAAHKHVPMMEYHPDEAVMNNIIGTKNVAELADEYGAERVVMISTDKAINPTSVMGASKRVAEMVVKDLGSRKNNTKFVAVRFGNVLESNGSVVPMFKQQIAEGGPVTVTDREVKRYFMTLPEASQLVIQAGALGKGGEVFVLDMGEPVKVLDMAEELIRLSGLEVGEDIEIKIVGLRPGEKLFEELLTEKERSRVLGDSGHEKIFIAETEEVDEEKLEKDVKKLESLAKEMDNEGVVRKLQEMVPNYRPNRGMLK